MSRVSYGLKREDLITERMLADYRLWLSLASIAVVIKMMSEAEMNVTAIVTSLTLLLSYSVAMRLVIHFRPEWVRTAAMVSSVLELFLITYLIKATWYEFLSPCYLWYVFYIVSLSTRYGAHYAIVGMAPSAVLYTAVSLSSSNLVPFVPGALGSTGFLFVLAFLFGHMSERQRNYQKQILVANELAIQLASLPSSREIIEYLLEQTKELLELEKCWFVQYRNDEENGELMYAHGMHLTVSELHSTFGRWHPEFLMKTTKASVSNRVSVDDGIPAETIRALGLKSMAAVPMFVRDEHIGILYAANRTPSGFMKHDLDLLELLATQAAPAIENSQLWERLKDAAASDERLRIARDLHDNFLQTLAAIKLHLERCRILVDKDSGRAKEAIGRIHEIATQGLAEVRAYLSELRLMGPEPDRLGQAISKCVTELASRAAFNPHMDLDLPESGIPAQVSLTAFQVARELVNNIAKHASATNVWLATYLEDEHVVIELRDDGVGFTPPANLKELATRGHLGLTGVEERIKAVHGALDIKSAPGEGTRVVVKLPVGEEGMRHEA